MTLKCSICGETLDSIEVFFEHVQNFHSNDGNEGESAEKTPEKEVVDDLDTENMTIESFVNFLSKKISTNPSPEKKRSNSIDTTSSQSSPTEPPPSLPSLHSSTTDSSPIKPTITLSTSHASTELYRKPSQFELNSRYDYKQASKELYEQLTRKSKTENSRVTIIPDLKTYFVPSGAKLGKKGQALDSKSKLISLPKTSVLSKNPIIDLTQDDLSPAKNQSLLKRKIEEAQQNSNSKILFLTKSKPAKEIPKNVPNIKRFVIGTAKVSKNLK